MSTKSKNLQKQQDVITHLDILSPSEVKTIDKSSIINYASQGHSHTENMCIPGIES